MIRRAHRTAPHRAALPQFSTSAKVLLLLLKTSGLCKAIRASVILKVRSGSSRAKQ